MFSGFSVGAQQELVEALQNEINVEKNMPVEDLHESAAPSIPGFEIFTDGADVRLTKNHGIDENFNVNNSVDRPMDFGDVNNTVDLPEESEDAEDVNNAVDLPEDSEDVEDETSEDAPVSRPNFSVQVIKGDERLCFEMGVIDFDEEFDYSFQIDEFCIAPVAKDGEKEIPESVYASFSQDGEQVPHEPLFVRYLEERGITDKFCDQLVKFATYHEHSLYVNMLDKIKGFVSKNGKK